MHYSPLRYPGGKNRLSPFIAKICVENNINGHYVEPYSGGASVALFLLFEGFVNQITINDYDRSIYAFWYCVLNKTNELCEKLIKTSITIEEWYIQKEIQKNKKNANILSLGFSTLFLNRTNRSGIINAGAIGGLKQNGNYLIDCRFNKESLIKKIKLIASKKKQIRLYKKDALKLIDFIENESILKRDNNYIFYFDPPYFEKGSSLYMNHYQKKHHRKVSQRIQKINDLNWIVSYDNVTSIKELYKGNSKKEYTLTHSANKSKEGKEVLFFSPNLKHPQVNNYNPSYYKYIKLKYNTKIIYKDHENR